MIAFVSQVAETVGPEGRYLHLGLTSSDVVDTALALQLRAAGSRLLDDADRLTAALVARARTEAGTVMMGRTHSVHAEPTTFGLKCAGWAFEVARGRERLAEATAEIATGKISGPVGTYSHLAPDIEAEVLAELGLRVDPVSTQIVQRDRHAAFLAAIAILGGTLERLATEVRNLQHTEIAEVMEPFRRARRAARRCPTSATRSCPSGSPGSPACSAATPRPGSRTSRCGTSATSATARRSGSRCPTPRSCSTTCSSGRRAWSRGSSSGPERMRENIERGLGLHASSRVLLALVERGGLSREDAYAIVQRNALRAADERVPLQQPARDRPAGRAEAAAGRARRLLRRRRAAAPRARGHRPPRPRWRRVRCGCAEAFVRAGQGPRPVPGRRRPAAARRVRPAVGVRRRPADARSPTRAAC